MVWPCWVVIAIAILAINLSCILFSHHAMATLLSGLGNDGRRKRLKLQPQSLNPPQPKAARPLPILHRVLVLPKQSFNEFIRHQIQALIFLLLF